MRDDVLLTVFLVFLPLSFMSLGGGASIVAPVYQEAVEIHAWMTSRQFIDYFALSRAAPGPGAMIFTLVGWAAAGWWGALVATLTVYVPTSVLTYVVAGAWNRYRGTKIHTALERGLAPVALGLITAAAVVILDTSDTGPLGWAIAVGATAFLVWRSVYPLWILAAGGSIYTLGMMLIG